MNNRERFFETLHYGKPDRVPYFEEGIRDDVITSWQTQGMPENETPWEQADSREEIKLDLDPHPWFDVWPNSSRELDQLRGRLDPTDTSRLPENWDPQRLKDRDGVLMVRVHEGLFLSMGVEDAKSFTRLMFQLADKPDFVREYMRIQGEFAAGLTESADRPTVSQRSVVGFDKNGSCIAGSQSCCHCSTKTVCVLLEVSRALLKSCLFFSSSRLLASNRLF